MTSLSPNAPSAISVIHMTSQAHPAPARKLRGFAALKARGDLERVKQIARAGAAQCVKLRRNHQWTAEEARIAGKIGAARRTEHAQARRAAIA